MNWRTYTTADGLASDYVYSMLEDRAGNLWFGTHGGGVSRYDGVSWRTYTATDGLASIDVTSILEDRAGNLWFGTYGGGVSRYDGVSWRTYTATDGLASIDVTSILEDRSGNLWFGGNLGVTHYDGVSWCTYTTVDGLAVDYVTFILEDHRGNLWFGAGGGGAIRHEPDRVSPQTVLLARPLTLSTSAAQIITFAAVFGKNEGVKFSYCLDGSPWSAWSPDNSWLGTSLSDGQHVFMVRARDIIGNVDQTAAVCTFEIDATPPMPLITLPASGQALRDSVAIRGTAADLRFKAYRAEMRPVGTGSWGSLIESSSPVIEGVLCGWNTTSLSDGNYELRLSVTDTLGLTGAALVRVIIDNHAPWAYETVPATVSTTKGGDVYTTDGEVHLYFPPHAFGQDVGVTIVELADSDVPDTLADGARRVFAGYEISWGGATLEKPATLELSYADAGSSRLVSSSGNWQRPHAVSFNGNSQTSLRVLSSGDSEPSLTGSSNSDSQRLAADVQSLPTDGTLALYVFGADSTWRRLGGTVDASAKRISSPLTEPGRYAVFTEAAGVPGASTLSSLSLTPRVFSPRGTFANSEVAISFTLGRPGSVTVKVYNRAGRLVREVISGEYMGAGANLVRWDGRDIDANIVGDGLYLVAVEALGQKQVKTLAVVR
jgi:hypothetical protein